MPPSASSLDSWGVLENAGRGEASGVHSEPAELIAWNSSKSWRTPIHKSTLRCGRRRQIYEYVQITAKQPTPEFSSRCQLFVSLLITGFVIYFFLTHSASDYIRPTNPVGLRPRAVNARPKALTRLEAYEKELELEDITIQTWSVFEIWLIPSGRRCLHQTRLQLLSHRDSPKPARIGNRHS